MNLKKVLLTAAVACSLGVSAQKSPEPYGLTPIPLAYIK